MHSNNILFVSYLSPPRRICHLNTLDVVTIAVLEAVLVHLLVWNRRTDSVKGTNLPGVLYRSDFCVPEALRAEETLALDPTAKPQTPTDQQTIFHF